MGTVEDESRLRNKGGDNVYLCLLGGKVSPHTEGQHLVVTSLLYFFYLPKHVDLCLLEYPSLMHGIESRGEWM